MINLIFYVFVAFGLAYVVGHSAISKSIREKIFDSGLTFQSRLRRILVDLLECPACFGFWTGVVVALLGWTPLDVAIFSGSGSFLFTIVWGLFTAGSNLTLAKITKLID